MAKQLIRGADIMGDRYRYDWGRCSYANGWAQIDTRQDASYYGTWTNPERREIFNYCEGDLCLTRCDTDEEYIAAVRETADWNRERDYWLGIDPGNPGNTCDRAAFERLGLGDLLH